MRKRGAFRACIAAALLVVVALGLWLRQDPAVSDTAASDTATVDTTFPETTIPVTTIPVTTVPETTVPETTIPETTVPDGVDGDGDLDADTEMVCSTNLGCQRIDRPYDCTQIVGVHAPGFFSTVVAHCPDPMPDVTVCTNALDDEGRPVEGRQVCAPKYRRTP